MTEDGIHRRRIKPVPLAGTALMMVMLLWATSTVAATHLKDIRIGEYENFTRVVFEFDAPFAIRGKLVQRDNRTTIVFANATPDFIRRIPVSKTDQIRHVRLFSIDEDLRAILFFPFRHYRLASLRLDQPPRLAVDIYPLARRAPSLSPQLGDQQPIMAATKMATGLLPIPLKQTPAPAPRSPEQDAAKPKMAEEKAAAAAPQRPATSPEPSNVAAPEIKKPRNVTRQLAPMAPAKSGYSSLQQYLILFLIAVTIGILILLVVLLISRNRVRENGRETLRTDDFLARQDRHIAQIDAQIQEELKRYNDV